MKIYIVQGATGEYSDHREWLVAAFFSEANAQSLVVNASRRADELYLQYGSSTYYTIPDGANEFDLDMQKDYNGTRYSYEVVEIKDKPI